MVVWPLAMADRRAHGRGGWADLAEGRGRAPSRPPWLGASPVLGAVTMGEGERRPVRALHAPARHLCFLTVVCRGLKGGRGVVSWIWEGEMRR